MPLDFIKNHESYLFCTDLEPDDVQAQRQLFQHLKLLAQTENPIVQRRVCFVVGEGHGPLKYARQQRLIEQFKAEGLLSDNIAIQIIEGCSTDHGPQRGFEEEGFEVLTQAEIAIARKRPREPIETVNKNISEFIKVNKNTLVISLKPVFELLNLHKRDPDIFKQHVFAGSGGFNFRAIFPKRPFKNNFKAADPYRAALKKYEIDLQLSQESVINLLNAFKEAYMYETFTATRTSSTSELNAAEFFKSLKAASRASSLGSLKVLIENWGEHLLSKDRAGLPEVLQEIINRSAGKINSQDQTIILDNVCIKLYKELSAETLQSIYAVVDKVKDALGQNDSIYVGLKRLVNKWKNMTECGLQFVNADPGILAVMTGACEDTLELKPVKLSFIGDYTRLAALPAGKPIIFSYAPKGLSIDDVQKDDKLLEPAEKDRFDQALNSINRRIKVSLNRQIRSSL